MKIDWFLVGCIANPILVYIATIVGFKLGYTQRKEEEKGECKDAKNS